MLETWLNVLTHPGEAAFVKERQDPEATLNTALLWIAGCAAVGATITIILGNQTESAESTRGLLDLFLPTQFLEQFSSSFLDQAIGPNTTGTLMVGGLVTVILTVVSFLIGVGIQFLIAKLFGGTGAFGRYAFLLAAFAAPLSIVLALSELVPWIGGPIGLAISIYQIVLGYFATKVEHSLSRGKTIAVVIAPFVLLVIVGGIAAIAASAMGAIT